MSGKHQGILTIVAIVETGCEDEYWLTSDEIVNLLTDHLDGREGVFLHVGNVSPPDPGYWDQHDGTYPNWTYDCGTGKRHTVMPSLARGAMEPKKPGGEGECPAFKTRHHWVSNPGHPDCCMLCEMEQDEPDLEAQIMALAPEEGEE